MIPKDTEIILEKIEETILPEIRKTISSEIKKAISSEIKETISSEVKKTISSEIKEIISSEIREMAKSFVNEIITGWFHNQKYFDEFYIDEQEFRDLIGLGDTQFYDLKALGCFDKAMHPATKKRTGKKGVKYHKWFNLYTQKIELPESLSDRKCK